MNNRKYESSKKHRYVGQSAGKTSKFTYILMCAKIRRTLRDYTLNSFIFVKDEDIVQSSQ
jgi:hypothetical protein